MNNLESIISLILSGASEKAEEIKKTASDKVKEIETASEKEISEISKKAEKDAMSEYQAIISRADSAAKTERREILLKAKTALIDKVYDDACSFIINLPDKKYAEIMSRLLSEAILERLETVQNMTKLYDDPDFEGESKIPFEVVLNEKDNELHHRDIIAGAEIIIANKELPVPKIKLAKETCNIEGGFIVRYGDAETNCSVRAMVSSLKEKTYTKVAKILFK